METVNIILAIIAGVFGTGWGIQFLWYRYERRQRAAATKASEIDVEAKEDEMRDAKLVRAYDQIVKLQEIVDKERGRWIAIATELSEVKAELIRENEARKLAEKNKCTRDDCTERVPPRIRSEQ